ncbi:unnamed protein product [Adineta steineri]|uniref:G-protein coupled receptors family 1 profile domain-containing protein n=1 Tax=Adineta steineri TaxID=433720 RepID=A0A818J8F3_9BILA|nr:unnamed protein product [Adineta steineri]
MGETEGTVVAGGNGQGDRLDQLSFPTYLSVDRDQSVYVSDFYNNRVMKWMKDATEGIIVAGHRNKGNDLTQLNGPQGVFVDLIGTVYVADRRNHQVMRWFKGTTQGDIIVGGNKAGQNAHQLNMPQGLSFDRYVYHTKGFFKKKRWIAICIGSQWIAAFVTSLPIVFRQERVCVNELWMKIYTVVMFLFIPCFINLVLNIRIFVYVRTSSRRIQPQSVNTGTGNVNNQQEKVSRRDIKLLQQMILMFLIFLGGWTPFYVIMIVTSFISLDPNFVRVAIVWAQLFILIDVMNLFKRNHEIREYLLNNIRVLIRW